MILAIQLGSTRAFLEEECSVQEAPKFLVVKTERPPRLSETK